MVQVIEIVTPDCGVCKMIAPAVNQAMKEFTDANGGDFEFKKLTVGHDAEAGDLAREHGIKAVPTFLIYRDAKLMRTYSWPGANVQALRHEIEHLLKENG